MSLLIKKSLFLFNVLIFIVFLFWSKINRFFMVWIIPNTGYRIFSNSKNIKIIVTLWFSSEI